jgi:hypothetical protein
MRGAIESSSIYTIMLTLSKLRALCLDEGEPIRPLAAAIGVEYQTLYHQIRRGTPELSEAARLSAEAYLKRRRAAITAALR